jgi:hypothetical protein
MDKKIKEKKQDGPEDLIWYAKLVDKKIKMIILAVWLILAVVIGISIMWCFKNW